MRQLAGPVLLLLLVVPLFAAGRSLLHSTAAMESAARGFLDSLTPDQRAQASFDFADEERFNWHFIPRERRGLPLKQMTAAQRERVRTLLVAGLGQRGQLKAQTIIELELVLRELGGNPVQRDPELYFVSIFGTPASRGTWGWRFEGHHLSVNFTIKDGTAVATAPSFFGANPAHVRQGSRQGLRALAAEEDLARELMLSLSAEQRVAALIAAEAPRDIITMNAARVDPLNPTGLPASGMTAAQTAQLRRLIDEYLARMSEDVAAQRRTRLERNDFRAVTFAWAGSVEGGQPHYYRVQGPSFLIEYDNTQNNANHIHSVWRDFAGDFGRDLLGDHYHAHPHPH